MPTFALKYPYFIIMACLVITVIGITTIAGMPVDLFPTGRYTGGCGGYILFWHASATD